MDRVEFIKEQQHLDQTLEILNSEILTYIDKRKGITDYILEHRKSFLEEYKDDEDKIIDYFDHERYVKEEAYKAIDRKLAEFSKLKDSPYFGKISFTDGDYDENLYVGRYGLTPDGLFEPVIVDWRAPVSALFYKGKIGESSYKTPNGTVDVDITNRRQFIIKKAELEGFFDSEIDVKDEILQMVLSSNSENKLKDIVMTIQKEQDEIIRTERNKVIVVNGVAGSGKTTIALHRVSYLLYNYREQLDNKVLILGPNDIFVDYISEILPSLGESGITQKTFLTFALEQIKLQEPVIEFTEYIERALNGNSNIVKEIQYKESEKFIADLDNEVNSLENQYFNIEPIVYNGEVIVSVEEINELFNKHYKYMPLFRRSEKIKRILTSKIKDKRDEEVWNLNKEIQETIDNLTPEELEMEKNNIEFNRRIRIRDIVREVINSRSKLEEWISHKDIVNIYKEFMHISQLSYLDLPGILYLMIKLDGKKVREEIKHIVIDEAQDYSYLQFAVIKELTGCISYTIVGDCNQRLLSGSKEPGMLRLKELFGGFVVPFELNKSYRSTHQIMEYSNKLLDQNQIVPFVRKGEFDVLEDTVEEEDIIDVLLELIYEYDESKYENIAIITKGQKELSKISPKLKEKLKILSFDNEDVIYKGGKVIIPSYFAKGLEFDGVIVVDYDNNTDNLLKYIMCTRALHRLSVIKVK